jgi:phage shock protein PspC (stress-responsive transcriptional regulator)
MSSIWTIRRSATDSKLSGLCAGIAQHWGVDPVLIRVGFVLLALSGGIGIVLYVAGWLLVPVAGKSEGPIFDLLGDQARKWPRDVWVMLVVVCCVVVFTLFGTSTPFGFWPAIILALIWYFGYYKNRQPSGDRSGSTVKGANPGVVEPTAPQHQFFTYPGPVTPFTRAADAWRQRIEEAARQAPGPWPPASAPRGPSYPPAPPPFARDAAPEPVGLASELPRSQPYGAELGDPGVWSQHQPASLADEHRSFLARADPVGLYAPAESTELTVAPAPPDRSRSRSARTLRLLSLIVVGLTLAGLGLAEASGISIPMAAYFGAALLVLGLTLVLAAWFGRARGILPVALLLVLATVGTSISGPVAQERNWGSHQVAYTSAADLVSGDRSELGQLSVDLSKVKLTSDASYTAHLGVGLLEVTVPPNANVVINWRLKSGTFEDAGKQVKAGSDLSGVVNPPSPNPKYHTLTHDLSVDLGKVDVRR